MLVGMFVALMALLLGVSEMTHGLTPRTLLNWYTRAAAGPWRAFGKEREETQ